MLRWEECQRTIWDGKRTDDWLAEDERAGSRTERCLSCGINHSTQIIKQTLVEGVSRTKDKLGLNPRGKTCGEATWGSNGQNVHPPQRHPYAPSWAVNPGRQSEAVGVITDGAMYAALHPRGLSTQREVKQSHSQSNATHRWNDRL